MSIPANSVAIPGSERAPVAGTRSVARPLVDEEIEVTVVVRPRAALPVPTATVQQGTKASAKAAVTRANFAANYGADPKDIAAVKQFATDHQLRVVRSSAKRRNVILAGSAQAMRNAFGVELFQQTVPNSPEPVRVRQGAIYVPRDLADVIQGVFGFDTRPQAQTHFRIGEPIEVSVALEAVKSGKVRALAPKGFSPRDIGNYYNFPTDVNGNGQAVAILELGGGYRRRDLTTYFRELGLKTPKINAISVDHGKNNPSGDPNSADGEVMLDVEIVGAVAQGARIVVYFAPNTDRGFLDAISSAIHDSRYQPSIISISWGAAESEWTGQALQNMNQVFQEAAALGVTVFCAAGDNGSSDGVANNGKTGDSAAHVDFPASSPYVVACGGTHIEVVGDAITREVVWNDGKNGGATGGGISDQFEKPEYQQAAKIPPSVNADSRVGRGVPDVAGDASPRSGYLVRVDGQEFAIGGTSAVAPLWAGLTALLNQALKRPLGYINPQLYQLGQKDVFRDIITGNNDLTNVGGYAAQKGWDPCTGLGSPDGKKLLSALRSG